MGRDTISTSQALPSEESGRSPDGSGSRFGRREVASLMPKAAPVAKEREG